MTDRDAVPSRPPFAFSFVYAFLLGFLLWALSPWLFGVAEPWDTDSHVYPAVLVSGGVILAQLEPRPIRRWGRRRRRR